MARTTRGQRTPRRITRHPIAANASRDRIVAPTPRRAGLTDHPQVPGGHPPRGAPDQAGGPAGRAVARVLLADRVAAVRRGRGHLAVELSVLPLLHGGGPGPPGTKHIVCADADRDTAASGLLWGAF